MRFVSGHCFAKNNKNNNKKTTIRDGLDELVSCKACNYEAVDYSDETVVVVAISLSHFYFISF